MVRYVIAAAFCLFGVSSVFAVLLMLHTYARAALLPSKAMALMLWMQASMGSLAVVYAVQYFLSST